MQVEGYFHLLQFEWSDKHLCETITSASLKQHQVKMKMLCEMCYFFFLPPACLIL